MEVARTIRAVAAGEAVCPAALSVVLFQWVARNKPAIPSLHLKNRLGLSRREQQLVGLIQQGLTNKEMASRLNLSKQTVKNHVHRMLRKVGAADRLSIVDVCCNNQHIGLHLFDNVRQVAHVLDLAHHLNVRLVGNCSHHQFSHQADDWPPVRGLVSRSDPQRRA